MKNSILSLIKGFRNFHEKYFGLDTHLYKSLTLQGQSPKTLFIACSDSRVDPALVVQAEPGDIFVVRNVANLVPPFEKGGGFHGVSSAIEFAVRNLQVENIVVMGHSACGGINALMTGIQETPDSFLASWVKISQRAKEKVLAEHSHESQQEQNHHCEKESILVSLQNLQTFPFVQARLMNDSLKIYGWYFNMEEGTLSQYNPHTKNFETL